MYFNKTYYSKQTRRRFINILYWIICVVIICFFICYSIHLIYVKYNIEAEKLKEYSGKYTLKISNRGSNNYYTFILGNGDIIHLSSINNIKDIQNNHKLHFLYAAPQNGVPPTYTAVEITTSDHSFTFLNKKEALNEINGGIVIGLSMAVMITLLSITPMILGIIVKKRFMKK